MVIRDRSRDDFMVKRIIGVPGDRIQLRRGRVYANGGLLKEPYVAAGSYTYSRQLGAQTIIVGKDSYFVMGDNRLTSEDSRSYGDVDRADLVGLISP